MKTKKVLVTGLLTVAVMVLVLVGVTLAPEIKGIVNNWIYGIQKTDDVTSYKTRKKVEDTLRAYQASYEADKITYDTNRMNDSEECQMLANAAKTRANRTAATYNTYYLKNSYVWKDNVPVDIAAELEYIK